MTNYEHYKEEIKRITDLGLNFAVIKNTQEIKPCPDPTFLCEDCLFENCFTCNMKKFKWADEKYQKHEVDWSKVPVDTKVWVRNIGDYEWFPRYFAKYENEIVYTWRNGVTSFSIGNSNDLFTCWKYARLAEEE